MVGGHGSGEAEEGIALRAEKWCTIRIKGGAGESTKTRIGAGSQSLKEQIEKWYETIHSHEKSETKEEGSDVVKGDRVRSSHQLPHC